MRVREIKQNSPLSKSGITGVPRERQRWRKEEEEGEDKRENGQREARNCSEKEGKNLKHIFFLCCNVTMLTIKLIFYFWHVSIMRHRCPPPPHKSRSQGQPATLTGFRRSHSAEELSNFTVSSSGSQHHGDMDVLITGFLVENDRPSNWFHPLRIIKPISQTRVVKLSYRTAAADFYSFIRSLCHGLNDFPHLTIPFVLTVFQGLWGAGFSQRVSAFWLKAATKEQNGRGWVCWCSYEMSGIDRSDNTKSTS